MISRINITTIIKHAQRAFCTTQQSTEISTTQLKDVEKKRDISRLPKHLRGKLLHALSPPDPTTQEATGFPRTTKSKQKIYAKYGRGSGIDPGVLWPSEDELCELIKDEKKWEPTLQQLWSQTESEIKSALQKRLKKEALVEKQMAKMPKLINEFKASLAKAEHLVQEQELKKQALRNEAREYFGYDMDPRDPRFKQMVEMKEEQEKLAKKKKKKQMKEAKQSAMIDRLMQK